MKILKILGLTVLLAMSFSCGSSREETFLTDFLQKSRSYPNTRIKLLIWAMGSVWTLMKKKGVKSLKNCFLK